MADQMYGTPQAQPQQPPGAAPQGGPPRNTGALSTGLGLGAIGAKIGWPHIASRLPSIAGMGALGMAKQVPGLVRRGAMSAGKGLVSAANIGATIGNGITTLGFGNDLNSKYMPTEFGRRVAGIPHDGGLGDSLYGFAAAIPHVFENGVAATNNFIGARSGDQGAMDVESRAQGRLGNLWNGITGSQGGMQLPLPEFTGQHPAAPMVTKNAQQEFQANLAGNRAQTPGSADNPASLNPSAATSPAQPSPGTPGQGMQGQGMPVGPAGGAPSMDINSLVEAMNRFHENPTTTQGHDIPYDFVPQSPTLRDFQQGTYEPMGGHWERNPGPSHGELGSQVYGANMQGANERRGQSLDLLSHILDPHARNAAKDSFGVLSQNPAYMELMAAERGIHPDVLRNAAFIQSNPWSRQHFQDRTMDRGALTPQQQWQLRMQMGEPEPAPPNPNSLGARIQRGFGAFFSPGEY